MHSELLSWRTFLSAFPEAFATWDGFFGSILESWSEWSKSRRWWIILATAPVAVILMMTVAVIAVSHLQTKDGLVQTLIAKGDSKLDLNAVTQECFTNHLIRNGLKNDLNQSPSSSSDIGLATISKEPSNSIRSERESKLKEEVELLLQRASSLSPNSSQIKYRMAILAAKGGEFDSTQRIMEELADEKASIFVPAHVWCAISMLGNKKLTVVADQELLEEHLKYAITWKYVDPILKTVYSTILLKSGKTDKAILIAKEAAEARPELNLPYAQILKHSGSSNKTEMEQAAKRAEQAYRSKLGSMTEIESDRINCANAILLTDRSDVALELLREGLGSDPSKKPVLRRFFSDLCVSEYRKENVGWLALASIEKTASDSVLVPASSQSKQEDTVPTEINWSRLLEAAKIDPDNPMVGQEIAFQVRNRQKTPMELNETLLRQLKNGSASTSCRLLVAERYLERNRIPEARTLWEQILEKDPLCLPALNNLSVMISRDKPPNAKRALELIDLAYRTYPSNAEVCDSYGEINKNLGRAMEAVSKYEEAIRINPTRVESRIHLAACYREAGLADIAIEQEKIVESIKSAMIKEKAEKESQNQKTGENETKEKKSEELDKTVPQRSNPPKSEPPKKSK